MSLHRWVVGLCLALVLVGSHVVAGDAEEPVRFDARGETQAGEGGELRLDGHLTGATTGRLVITVLQPGEPISGHWRLSLLDGAEEHVVETGSLAGTLTDGRIVTEPDGTVVGLAAIAVTVAEGTGSHADVTAGTGTLDIHFGAGSSTFGARLALSY